MIKKFLQSIGRFLLDFWYLYFIYAVILLALWWTASLRDVDLAVVADVAWISAYALVGVSLFLYWRWRRIQKDLQQLSQESHLAELPTIPTFTSTERHYQTLVRQQIQDLAATQAALDQQGQDLQDYYALWVHQIKVPLSVLDLMSQTGTVDMSQTRRQLLAINQYLEMMLQYVRLQNFNQDLNYEKVAVRPILVDILKDYRYWFIEKDLSVILGDSDFTVTTDPKWLRFVLEQLIFNAIKYTEAGQIQINCTPNQTMVIEDSGIGIAAADLPLIFQAGYTGYNGRLDQNASGLGLYLVQEILSRLGHGITITAEVGVGTQVTVDLAQDNFS
ncbi:sensor histidine kinase [Lactobacillaceae bacterium L1_55_11]|nr:sensor histidine kinase [Lactobacillaceae bacterium L1_55_11]